jgi:MoaA/NifB/PqqE/SkfB family radical SAM enzyme
VKISGGEPFVHPTLEEIVAGLAALGHRVSVVTNFSASRERLAGFVRAAAGRAGVFPASLHLEYIEEIDAFIDKARWLEGRLAAAADAALPAPSLCVTCVATREALPRLPALRARFADAGLTFKVQPEKQGREVILYGDEERAALLALGGHNLTGEIVHALAGRPCWAGARYFILDDRGEAFRCYPARRFRLERMGSFLDDDFRLADAPAPCLYKQCNCTVPITRGMMPLGVKP